LNFQAFELVAMTQYLISTKRRQLDVSLVVGLLFLIGCTVPMLQAFVAAWHGPAARGWADHLLSRTFMTAFVGTFGVVFLMGWLLQGRRLPAETVGQVPADEPWRARGDWASGRIAALGSAESLAAGLKVLAGAWLIFSLPLIFRMPDLIRESIVGAVIATIFPAVCILIYLAARQQTQIFRRFGEPTLHLSAVPGVVGGQLAGEVRIPRTLRPPDGFQVKISCLELIRRGKMSREVALWKEEQQVPVPAFDDDANVTSIPFRFAIPNECRETSRIAERRPIRWMLEVRAQLPGLPFRTSFEVPVFETSASRVNRARDPAAPVN
jgi:hypothetical protein